MNLKEWAAEQGIHYQTAYRWFRKGVLPVPARKVGGLILVNVEGGAETESDAVVVYARVSSSDQSADLDRQVRRVTEWAVSHGLTVGSVVTEVGSALNGKRQKFLNLLSDPSARTIVVEHRERFARFGAEYVQAALASSGRRLLVVDPDEVDDDLVRDMTEVLTSMCARLYGRRSAANRAKRALEAASDG